MARTMWVCPQCGAVKAGFPHDICKSCGCPVCSTGVTFDEWIDWDDEKMAAWEKEMQAKYAPNATEEARQKRWEYDHPPVRNVPKCPTCGSANIRSLSRWERISHDDYRDNKTGKTFQCSNCGYTW